MTYAHADEAVSAARGRALFEGVEGIPGHIRGHLNPMPASVLACVTCRAGNARVAAVPALDAVALLTPKSRRYGPPSAYSLVTFCRALKTGVDPVYVTLSRSMPAFQASQSQCESLWLYLIERKPA